VIEAAPRPVEHRGPGCPPGGRVADAAPTAAERVRNVTGAPVGRPSLSGAGADEPLPVEDRVTRRRGRRHVGGSGRAVGLSPPPAPRAPSRPTFGQRAKRWNGSSTCDPTPPLGFTISTNTPFAFPFRDAVVIVTGAVIEPSSRARRHWPCT